MQIMKISVVLAIWLFSSISTAAPPYDEQLTRFLEEINQDLAVLYNKEVLAGWQAETKGPNDLIALLQSGIATKEILSYLKAIAPRVAKFRRLPIEDATLLRQLKEVPEVGYEALDRDDWRTLYAVTNNMSDIYLNAQLCSFNDRNQCNLTLVPDVQNILQTSMDLDEIEYYWLEWRQKKGLAAKDDFIKFIQLYRKTSRLNGFAKASDFWFKDLEENSDEAMALLNKLFTELRPLFEQFHAHVRFQLRKIYGVEIVPEGKPYPQNLAEIYIGRAFTRNEALTSIRYPYPELGIANITEGLLRRGISNPQRLFWNLEEFFRSLGFPQLEETFWDENAAPKAPGFIDEERNTCWAKAWKYYGIGQVNLSYCPTVDEERFSNMLEALSDVYYYRAYQAQPTLFQEEPIPHFSDAIGKVFSLAGTSPTYLTKLKIIPEEYTSAEARINRLYLLGLRTIFLMPIFYVLDRYRVEVLDEKIDTSDNCAFWGLTEQICGAEPPVVRTNNDFDAPAKLLVEVDDQYTSQILSIVIQFQLYKHFCEFTGQYDAANPELPLDLCDLSNQRDLGPIIMEAFSLGSSRPYTEILSVMTNQTELSMDGLMHFFQPLYNWLLEENNKNNAEIGWQKTEKCIP